MSRLRVYWPQGAHQVHVEDGEPVILSFKSHAEKRNDFSVADLITRARTLHENKRCPHCEHPIVEPIELADAAFGRGRQPIPGTATLVGFRCQRCLAEWLV